MDMVDLPVLPSWGIPKNPELGVEVPLPTLELKVPQDQDLILPSAKQMRQQIQAEQEELDDEIEQTSRQIRQATPQRKPQIPVGAQFKEVTEFTLPGTDITLPVPRKEILSTAIVTAGASSVAAVAGTLVASTLLKRLVKLLKPVMKTGMKRLAKLRGRPAPETFGRQRLRLRRNKENRADS